MTAIDLLLLHSALTWALIGLIWTIQLVQYPGFALVGEAEFASFHDHHSVRITWIVAPLMAGELFSGVALLSYPPPGISQAFLWIGMALIVMNWAITALVAMPLHKKLHEPASRALRALVATNWARTAAWSARGAWTLFALRLTFSQA